MLRATATVVVLAALLHACAKRASPGHASSAAPLDASRSLDASGRGDASGPDDAGPAASSEGPGATGARAEECLASPECPAAEAARLFVAADDARDPNVDCFRFADGTGAARDVARARGCLERKAKASDCAGSSADLELAELAMMRIDGVGGAANVAGARTLLAGCFDDATRSGILAHAAARERDPKTAAVDFCKDIGGTTITINECMARDGKNAETRGALEAKSVVAGLDAAGRELFASSEKAYAAYLTAMGAFVYEVYIEGSIRGAMALGAEQALHEARAKDLAELPRFVAKRTSPRELAKAERASALAVAGVATGTAAERNALEKTQHAWTAYRAAEVAFYEHVFGPAQGVERVRAAVLLRLESRRAKECAPPSAEPP